MKTIRSLIFLGSIGISILVSGCFSYHSAERPATTTSTTTINPAPNPNKTSTAQ